MGMRVTIRRWCYAQTDQLRGLTAEEAHPLECFRIRSMRRVWLISTLEMWFLLTRTVSLKQRIRPGEEWGVEGLPEGSDCTGRP
jgi:hypothetical protein